MNQPLLSVRGLRKRFGGLIATDSVDLDVVEGEIHALIGPNGAGRSSTMTLPRKRSGSMATPIRAARSATLARLMIERKPERESVKR